MAGICFTYCPILLKFIEYFGKSTTGILHESCSCCKSRGSFYLHILNVLIKVIQFNGPEVLKLVKGINEMSNDNVKSKGISLVYKWFKCSDLYFFNANVLIKSSFATHKTCRFHRCR